MTKEPAARITNVEDLYKHVRSLVGMVANCWGWTSGSKGHGGSLPVLVRVHGGKDQTAVVPGYLLQDLGPALVEYNAALDVNEFAAMREVHLRQSTAYFKHIILLCKLRWLLRLHSACCEIDYKMCSLRPLIQGLQYVVTQQHAEAVSDSLFDSKVSQHVGSHLNLESVLDDIADQLKGSLAGAWGGFLQFVSTCDPTRCLMASKMDSVLTQPQIHSNEALATSIDTVFVVGFLRRSRKEPASRLKELYSDLEMVGLPLPEVPALRGAPHLRAFVKAKTKPSRLDRERASRKDSEKLAQLDAVLLTVAVELHYPEVLATSDELAAAALQAGATEPPSSVPAAFGLGAAPEPVDFGSTGKSVGGMGPPAARVIIQEKPKLSPALFDLALHCIHHHLTFPDGIRERLYVLLVEEYGLTKEQSQRLAISMTQNIDGKRLPESVLMNMERREKARLREYSVRTCKDTSHLLVSPLVACPIEKGKPAKYSHAFTASSLAQQRTDPLSKSLPDLFGRSAFKVPLQTGPLTMDPDTNKLRTTGFFIRMPPIG